MRNFLKIFLRSLGTYLGVGGDLARPSFMVGFPRLVILITYGMRNFTMEAISLVCILATNLTSGTMCYIFTSFKLFTKVLACGLYAKSLLWADMKLFEIKQENHKQRWIEMITIAIYKEPSRG